MTSSRLGALGTRLAAVFVGVAVVAIAVVAVVILLAQRSDVAHLAAASHQRSATAMTSALDNAYRARGGWAGADLEPAVVLAGDAGAEIEIEDTDGAVLLHSGPVGLLGATDSARLTRPLVVGGRQVGVLRLAFPAGGLSPADRRLRSELASAVGVSVGLAILVALSVAIVVTRLLVRPIRRLTEATRAVEAGRRDLAGAGAQGPGELGELGRAFTTMVASLEREEQLRHAMVADVAHELRTPLAVLQGELEALVDGVHAPNPETLSSLHEEILRLARMVEDLQTLASAQAAGLSLERHLVDLATVAASAADALAGRFEAKEIELVRKLAPAVVWADRYRMHQVITNLLANAAKFTPPGGRVELVVGVKEGWGIVEVGDSGPGIPPEEDQQIFERFFRGRAGRDKGGTGIGLSVVKELVTAHDGETSLHAEEGGGARFVVRLPLANSRQAVG